MNQTLTIPVVLRAPSSFVRPWKSPCSALFGRRPPCGEAFLIRPPPWGEAFLIQPPAGGPIQSISQDGGPDSPWARRTTQLDVGAQRPRTSSKYNKYNKFYDSTIKHWKATWPFCVRCRTEPVRLELLGSQAKCWRWWWRWAHSILTSIPSILTSIPYIPSNLNYSPSILI
jgi:hypothetical protein